MLQTGKSTTSTTSFFREQLVKHGPDAPRNSFSETEAQAYCRKFARKNYENFVVVSWLTPRRLRQDLLNVYAYCRWADNLADEVDEPRESLRLLDWWEQELNLCETGNPSHPVFIALRQTISAHQLPLEPFRRLLRAFRQDQTVHQYDSLSQLLYYCHCSANPVGEIVLRLSDSFSDSNLRCSNEVCTGLQITNFAQDIARDAARGRIYLPKESWEKHSVTETMFRQCIASPQLRSLTQEFVEFAGKQLRDGSQLVRNVAPWLASDIRLFVQGGLAILDQIRSQGYDVLQQRPKVSRWAKFGMLIGSLFKKVNHEF